MQEYGVAGGAIGKAIGILRAAEPVRTVTGRAIYVMPEDQRPRL